MIPLLLTIRVQWFRLWIPLSIVWLLLLPVVLLLLPLALIACLIVKVNALEAARVFCEIFLALSGTEVEVADGRHSVAIRIY